MESAMSRGISLILLAAVVAAGCVNTRFPTSRPPDSGTSSVAHEKPIIEPAAQGADNDRSPEKALAIVQQLSGQVQALPQSRPAPRTRPTTLPTAMVAEQPLFILPDPILPDLQSLSGNTVSLAFGPPQDPAPPHPSPAQASPTAPSAAVAKPPLEPLEGRLTKQAQESPRDLASQLDYQLLLLLKGQSAPQMETIASLSKEDREMVAALVDAIANLRANVRTDAGLLAVQKARPLLDLADRLRSQAQLRVGTLALCSRVDGFGVFQPVSAEQFLAGREHVAVLYCEVENFLPRQNEAGEWETRLTQEVVFYNDRGQRVWAVKPQAIRDVCRNRRHDFFVPMRLTIPSSLAAGQYSLRVTIVDQNANRVAENSLAVNIAAERS
jgi:hypothetical protein